MYMMSALNSGIMIYFGLKGSLLSVFKFLEDKSSHMSLRLLK